jgi:hypothetical protein
LINLDGAAEIEPFSEGARTECPGPTLAVVDLHPVVNPDPQTTYERPNGGE